MMDSQFDDASRQPMPGQDSELMETIVAAVRARMAGRPATEVYPELSGELSRSGIEPNETEVWAIARSIEDQGLRGPSAAG